MATRKKDRPKPKLADKPRWDVAKRTLYFRGVIVKRFKQPSENQEAILAELDAKGWPPRIDNPLYDNDKAKREERMHDGIKNLNLHQRNRMIHFGGDGYGTGIIWE